jgi:PAS domain S-box-containing protein
MSDLEQWGDEMALKFRLLSEHARDIVFRYRLVPSRCFEYVSPAVTPITGYTPEEHYADPDLGFKVVHPDDRDLLQQLLEGRRHGPVTLRFVHKDGHIIWVEQRHVWVVDESGQLIAIEGVGRDMTEYRRALDEAERRRRVAEGLADVERLLSQSLDPEEVGRRIVDSVCGLFEAISASLLRLEPGTGDFTVLAVSGDVEGSFGQHTHVTSGLGVLALAVQERRPVATSNLFEGRRCSLDFGRPHPTIARPHRTVLAIPLIQQERISGVLAITDQAGRIFTDEEIRLAQAFADQAATALDNAQLYQELQRAYAKLAHTQDQLIQAQKMEAIGRLAGGIAHDFNNLLTVIMGRADLVLNRLRNRPRLRRQLDLILSAADSAASLTQKLLAFSRRQELQPAVIDVNTVAVHVSAMLRWLIGEDIRVDIHLAPGLGHVKADAGQIEQVLVNLAVNARDAMPQGGQLSIETADVTLDEAYAQTHLGVQPGSYVRITVRDTSTGMDASTQAHIFEPFFTTKGPGRGTGLGLSTVYGIVTQSGGHVTVQSAVGEGTTFIIYLPAIPDPVETMALPLPAMAPPGGSETILLVEDEAMVRGLTREVLQMLGYRVIEAANGNEALQHCHAYAGTIDLMVTDVVMPGMSGPELAQLMMAEFPALRVLYLSGHTDMALGHHGVMRSSAALLHKPFTPDALARRVRDMLDHQPQDHSAVSLSS